MIEIALICSRKLARMTPHNYIALFIFTMLEAYWIAFMCQYYVYNPYENSFDSDGYRTVSTAGAMTVMVVASATAYAWTTKSDFT